MSTAVRFDYKKETIWIIRRYAKLKGMKHSSLWGRLYAEIYNRCGIDVYKARTTAAVEPKPHQIIDVIDCWDRVCAIAREIYQ